MGKKKLTDKRIRDAFESTYGNLSRAAERLQCTRKALYLRMEKNPDLAEFRRACEEIAIDRAEQRLHEAIDDSDPWAVKFLLSTKGKSRGYTRKVEVVNSGEQVLHIKGVNFGHSQRPQPQPTISTTTTIIPPESTGGQSTNGFQANGHTNGAAHGDSTE